MAVLTLLYKSTDSSIGINRFGGSGVGTIYRLSEGP